MDEPTHGEVQDSLILLSENLLDGEAASRLHEHLAGCPECRHEWEALQNLTGSLSDIDFGLALPAAAAPHLDEAALWRLADEPSGSPAGVDREAWRHALQCRPCFLEVAGRSRLLKREHHIDVPDSAAAADAVWNALQLRRVRVLLTWTGVALHIALRTPSGRRAARRRGTIDNPEATTEVDQSWNVQKQFGAYTVGLQVVPQDASRQVFRLSARLDGPTPLRARLEFRRAVQGDVNTTLGSGDTLSFSDLEPNKYSVDLIDGDTGDGLGRIELEFTGTAP